MMFKILQATFLALSGTLVLGAVLPRDDNPIVQVQQGSVQGVQKSTSEGNLFYAFLGIPYGKPPLDELRFKAPVPADPWDGVLQVTVDAPPCLQPAFSLPLTIIGEEDCLTLNVFTPSLPTTKNRGAGLLPVNVFIHGGGYFEGDFQSDSFGPERFMNKPILLVEMHYRLGPLGFISTGDSAASGNYGLLDQNLALQWVRDNIASFGGDPAQVTISGQSAGSSSVLFHVLSPMSAGLFHGAIAESGSALCPWALEENPLQYAENLGRLVGCTTNESTVELIDCLRLQDPAELQAKGMEVLVEGLALTFVPVVENTETGLFLTEDPTTLLEEGRFNRAPIVLGFNRDEGVVVYEAIYPISRDINDEFFDKKLPLLLRVITDYRQNLVNVSYAIKDEYYEGLDTTNVTAVDITNINLISDIIMKSWITKTAELISSHGVPTYLYAFNYVSSSAPTNFTGGPDISHSDELKFLYNMTVLSEKDEAWSVQFLDMWVNFMTSGNPSPNDVPWAANTDGGSAYMEINDIFSTFAEYDPEMMRFWFEEVPAIVYG